MIGNVVCFILGGMFGTMMMCIFIGGSNRKK